MPPAGLLLCLEVSRAELEQTGVEGSEVTSHFWCLHLPSLRGTLLEYLPSPPSSTVRTLSRSRSKQMSLSKSRRYPLPAPPPRKDSPALSEPRRKPGPGATRKVLFHSCLLRCPSLTQQCPQREKREVSAAAATVAFFWCLPPSSGHGTFFSEGTAHSPAVGNQADLKH